MDLESVSQKVDYKRSIFLCIILVSLGVVIINTSSLHSLGIVFIALGGLFLIIGMAKKKKKEAVRDE